MLLEIWILLDPWHPAAVLDLSLVTGPSRAMSGFDYSKWDRLEISDDESTSPDRKWHWCSKSRGGQWRNLGSLSHRIDVDDVDAGEDVIKSRLVSTCPQSKAS